ncbi:MAG: type II toxin-antitoxin system RelE/ParE family toxin [Candidatus Micrarchaeota archaeon]|nr:type II toxin-antitoxin system RelE/ParE family toxin [Candidatus Micrarchaeota archaeon]MBU1886761.1 type II toxin-antitoxin system RelE/ParE family toxin [Candidatus Micrarchaeota archaeon]
MNTFSIIWSDKSKSQLSKLPHSIANAIYSKVGALSSNPYNKNVKKLRGVKCFRLRVGDYRVIFDIEKNELQILYQTN